MVWVWRGLVGLGCSALLGWMALAISFDFSLLTATQISITASPTAIIAILAYVISGILVLVRRHRIELAPTDPAAATAV